MDPVPDAVPMPTTVLFAALYERRDPGRQPFSC